MICTMLHGGRPVTLDIWRVEQGVCFWPSWLSRLTSSSTVASGHVLFSTHVLWSAALVPVVDASCFPNLFSKVSFCSLSSKISSLSSLNRIFLNWCKFLVSALSSLLNGMLHYQCIVTALKIIIYNSIVYCCLQASIGSVSKTKRNLI